MPDQVEGDGGKMGYSLESTTIEPQVMSSNEKGAVQRSSVHHHFIHRHSETKSSDAEVLVPSSRPQPIQPNKLSGIDPTRLEATNDNPNSNDDGKTSSNQEDCNGTTSTSNSSIQEGNSDSLEGAEDEKKGGKKLGSVKKDRTNLRKGKWTVEEEEYTTRIIHHFSTGLLTLPEGTTLRSYLAEKLNCDPMRITKKFAGASCLGKRVYHLCDRSQATITDIEMAKQELGGLEHRFRLRVEHGQSGVPLHPRNHVVSSLPSPATQIYTTQTPQEPAAVAASWLQSIATTMSGQASGMTPTIPGQVPSNFVVARNPSQSTTNQPIQGANWPFASATLIPNAQWIAPAVSSAPIPAVNKNAAPSISSNGSTQQQMQAPTNEAITLAWAQAAASLTPALSQLAAANLQQHQQQLQKAYESQLQSYSQPSQQAQSQPSQATAQNNLPHQHSHVHHHHHQLTPAAPAPIQYVATPQQQIATTPLSIQPATTMPTSSTLMAAPPRQNVTSAPPPPHEQFARPPNAVPIAPQPPVTKLQHHNTNVVPTPIAAKPPQTAILQPRVHPKGPTGNIQDNKQTKDDDDDSGRSKEDEAAGSMLMGFLTSLRKGFMEAKTLKDKEDQERALKELESLPGSMASTEVSTTTASTREANDTSSGTMSQPADSSPEDSNSDPCKQDMSSSEESDQPEGNLSRGPPRKRHKTKIGEFTKTKSSITNIGEFTSQNVAAHTTRMKELHQQERVNKNSGYNGQ
mmetsp:Transcript_13535/g.19972  ORF Transcript_13535/g.19972 Transcript_13535/m.19972 type:complete len:743 (-) Transcript_13535:13-2241(-)